MSLVEVLVAVAIFALLAGAIALAMQRTTQGGRASTAVAATNQVLTRVSQQLAADVSGGQTVIQQASSERLDLLKLAAPMPVDLRAGSTTQGKATLRVAGSRFSNAQVGDVLLRNGRGDYTLTQLQSVTNVAGGQDLTFACPVQIPGPLSLHTFRRVTLATAAGAGVSGLPGGRLYRRVGDGAWTGVSERIASMKFVAMYGSQAQTLGTALSTPPARVSGSTLSGVRAAIVMDGAHRATNLATAALSPVASTFWACGSAPGAPANNLGKLQVNVTLDGSTTAPAGLTPTVQVTGAGSFSQAINRFALQAFPGRTAGLHNATASAITQGSNIYDPTITGSPANVGGGLEATINVDYRLRKGSVQINVSGLAVGGTTTVTLSGPEPRTLTVPNGATTLQLTPGAYTVTAANQPNMTVTVTPGSLTVASGVTSQVNVAYAPATGTITVNVAGLPSTAYSGTLTLSGPTARTQVVTNGTYTFPSSLAGSYTASAARVDVGSNYYTAASVTNTLTAGGSIVMNINYNLGLGTVRVAVSGLPASPSPAPSFTLSTGNGWSNITNTTYTFNSITPGNISVTGANTASGGVTYNATGSTGTLTSGTTLTLNLVYSAQAPGTLRVTVTGLPSGLVTAVRVRNSGGTEVGYQTGGNGTYSYSLAPATYTAAGDSVTYSGATYTAANQSGSVTSGGTRDVTLTYSCVSGCSAGSGTLSTQVSGLPSGATGTITTRNSANTSIDSRSAGNGTISLGARAAGTYSAAGTDVSTSSGLYRTSGGSVSLGTSGSATINVTYSCVSSCAGGGGGGSTGTLEVRVIGLPSGAATNISATGPQSLSRTNSPNGTYTFSPVATGTYTVSGSNVTYGGITFTAPSVSAVVPSGGVGRADLVFTTPNPRGELVVNISGLPSDPYVNTAITGSWLSQVLPVKNGQYRYTLPIGEWSTTPPWVVISGRQYQVTPDSDTVYVPANGTATMNFTYWTSSPAPSPCVSATASNSWYTYKITVCQGTGPMNYIDDGTKASFPTYTIYNSLQAEVDQSVATAYCPSGRTWTNADIDQWTETASGYTPTVFPVYYSHTRTVSTTSYCMP